MAFTAVKLTATVLLITVLCCSSLVAGSSHEVVPSLLQTLLEGSVEQLYAGPISRYNVDEMTSAALTELKKCIDELPPQHLKALVNLLVRNSFYYSHK
uniref:Secretoglobin family 1C member 1 n=1 Tax=Coturnix japonica TaxID=93934 RepID=A0A8C2U1A7_COTJA